MSFIGVVKRPYICASTQLIEPDAETTTKQEFNLLRKTVGTLQHTATTGLTFFQVEIETITKIMQSYASFENERGYKTQLGFS